MFVGNLSWSVLSRVETEYGRRCFRDQAFQPHVLSNYSTCAYQTRVLSNIYTIGKGYFIGDS